VSFQAIKTFKQSDDPDYEEKKNRVLELYEIVDGKAEAAEGGPGVVICVDEFGPLNLLPRAGKQWAPAARLRRNGAKRRRRRATYTRTEGVRRLFAALDLNRDKLYGHVKERKHRTNFLAFCKYLRSLYPDPVHIAIVLDNFSPHPPHFPPTSMPASASGRGPTTSSSLMCLRTPAGSTASSRISLPCATLRSTAPTTAATRSKTR
jgi:hypothetical protein